MPDARLPKLLRDLKSGQDISQQLKEIWGPSPKKPLSNADSLALAQAIAKTAETLHSQASLRAWHEAILALRRLAIFLKKPKSVDPLDGIAEIEKYCVNYALRACQAEHEDISIKTSASAVAAETLRLIFECRTSSKKRKSNDVARRSRKENLDPQEALNEKRGLRNHAYRLMFNGANNISEEDFLPADENLLVSSVITGAIAIRVASRCDEIPLPSRLALAQNLGASWAEHLSRSDGDRASIKRRSQALLMKMKNGLLIAAKDPGRHPVHVLKARVFAVALCEALAEEYAYNALRVVNSFLRRPERAGLSEAQDYEQVSEAYRDAVRFLEELEPSAATWADEDLSTLLDHIISTAARCDALGISGAKVISKSALSSLLQQRSADLKNLTTVPCEAFAHAFQEKIFSENVYSVLSTNGFGSLGKDAEDAINTISLTIQSTFPKPLVPVDKQFRKGPGKGLARQAPFCKKTSLRLLRVLEPFRRDICSASTPLIGESTSLMQLYLIALCVGLQDRTKCKCVSKNVRLSDNEITLRLGKMTGAGIEAAEKLITKYVQDGNSESVQACVQFINRILSLKSQSGSSWGIWISRRMYNASLESYNKSRADTSDSQPSFEAIGEVLLYGVQWLMPEETDAPDIKLSCFPDVVNMLVLSIHCYIAGENVDEALIVAAQKLLRSFCLKTSCLSRGMLPEPVRSNLLRTCGQVASLALQHNCMAEFLEEFSRDEPLSAPVLRNIGANFFQALGEYALIVRDEETLKNDPRSSSKTLRANVQAQNEILNLLELPGKCAAVQTYQEWTRLLLDGISSEITNSPRVLTDSGTLSLNNGENVEVPLGSRFCQCSICSNDNFVVLHILQGAWRAAMNRYPSVLQSELEKLEHFLMSSRLKHLHVSLVILSLDFLEWCQILSILSSIEDTGGLMPTMIQACKKELNLQCSSQDLGAIYASQGFLAGRPYYSHILQFGPQNEKNGTGVKDSPWSLIEKEKFMREGCRADIFVQNLDLKNAVTTAKKSLKSLLVKVMGKKGGGNRPVCSVGGVEFEVQIDIISADDRRRALQTVELIFAMERLGNINMRLENFNDGIYFLEKAVNLSKTLCGTESLLHLRQKSILYQANMLLLKLEIDLDNYLESESREFEVRSENKFDKTVISNSYALAADIAISAVHAGDGNDARAKELGQIADRLSNLALAIISETTASEFEASSSEIQVNSLISEDISLRTAEAQLLLGNVEKAALLFDKIRQTVHENRLDIYLRAILGLIRSLVGKLGGLNETRSLLDVKPAKTPRGRGARKTPRNGKSAVGQKIRSLLQEAVEYLEGSHWDPHIRTGLFLLNASILGPANVSTGLAWEIGSGFSLQWLIRQESIKPVVIELDPEDDLVHRVKDVHVSKDTPSHKIEELEKCQSLVYDMNIVLVGMSLDEDKSGIIFWRLSDSGFFSARFSIPTDGDMSYNSISSRITAVFEKMKNNAVKSGDSFTEDQKESWWENTFALDDDMSEILEDIQEEWFGPCAILLLPACSGPNDEIASDEAAQAVLALRTIEACYGEAVSRFQVEQAFAKLAMSKTPFEKALDVLPCMDKVESRIGNTVFLLDSRLEHFPFESLPILRKNNVGSTRVPSLRYFIEQLGNVRKRPNPKNVFYVLNPAGDLPRTEKKFRTVFEKRKGWRGISGSTANKTQILSEVQSAEIFLFCGHGGGEKYVSPRQMGNRQGAPIAVLMGCSSAKLTRRSGYRGSSGTPLDYLLHGAPAVVGNLWDVTDKDIDRLTASFLKQWLGVSAKPRRTLGIADSLAVARGACKLPHLVGAATVIYGLPFL